MKKFAVSIGIVALLFNLVGGASALLGVYFIAFKAGVQMFGWGDARTFGYLFFFVGLCVMCTGLVLARYARR